MRAKQATVAPQSTSGLYRAMIRFKSNHVKECAHVPLYVKDAVANVKSTSSNRTKAYWEVSAAAVGLRDAPEGGYIVYDP